MTGDVDSRNSNLRVLFFFFFWELIQVLDYLVKETRNSVIEIQITKMCYFVYHILAEYIAGYR